MIDPETLDEAKLLIAMLQKTRQQAIDQREEARAAANGVVQGFAKRAEALKVVMRQAKATVHVLEAMVEVAGQLDPLERRDALELATAAIDALDTALTR